MRLDQRTASIALLIFSCCLLVFTGCSDEDGELARLQEEWDESSMTDAERLDRRVQPTESQLVDGVQVIEITITPRGYEPNRIAVAAGTPVRAVFNRQSTSDCSETVQIPGTGIGTVDLPYGEETTVEFTVQEKGRFSFVCATESSKGTLIVREGASPPTVRGDGDVASTRS